jgi:hypothetical protein
MYDFFARARRDVAPLSRYPEGAQMCRPRAYFSSSRDMTTRWIWLVPS